MGYVNESSPDLFISYAHADDQGDEETKRPGWVTSFSRLLRKELDRKLGKIGACDLWMDHRIAAGAMFDTSLETKVRSSAVMLIVLSPGYVLSSWCQREMELFQEKASETGSASVFVIETDRVDRPVSLEKVQSIPFWAPLPDNLEITYQLGHPRPHEDDPEHRPFFSRLNSLTHAIATELKRLKSSVATTRPIDPRPSTRATIFLARGTDDVDDQYLELREYLLQQKYRVVPQADYPQEEARFVEEARQDLSESILFVQLLGSLAGKKLLGSSRRHVAAQHDLAVEARLPGLRWRSRALVIDRVENEEQAKRLVEPDVLALDLEEFKVLVVQKIEAILNPPPPPVQRPQLVDCLNKLIFINADAQDFHLAEQIGKTLEKMGAWVTLPYSADNDEELNPRAYLTEQLGECDGFLLVYGGTRGKWVSSQLLWSRKPLAQRPTPASIAIIEAPPIPKEPLNLLVPNLRFLRDQPGDLEEYVRSL